MVCDSPAPTTTYHCWYGLTRLDNDTLYDVKITANNIHGSSLSSKIQSFYVSTGLRVGGKERGGTEVRLQGKCVGGLLSS